MYKVLLVDDEPVAFKSIKFILEKRCKDLEVIATCANGQEGLEKARSLKPDIIITDIKMPVMDGISLARYVKKELPDTMVIILSGYQDFEYAKGAIQLGVCDYILKPIVPSEMIKVMDHVKERLEERYWQKRNRILQQLCRGMVPGMEEFRKCFGTGRYYALLIRKNGLPRRITMNQEIEVFSIQQEQVIMYGRDVQEGMYLYPEELLSILTIEDIAKEMVKKHWDGVGYVTVVTSKEPLQIHQFAEKIGLFYRTLAEKTVLGKNQFIFLDQLEKETKRNTSKSDPLKDVSVLLKAKKYDSVPERVRGMMHEWEEQECTQLWMEGMIRQLFYMLRSEGYLDSTAEEVEFAIEDAFYDAVSIQDLEESILDQMESKKRENVSLELKMDTPEYFQRMKEYIARNMAEPLTLQQICRHFGVSQPYVSKFFRKYEGTSFGNYLTQVRIQKAKELFLQNREILIKDVAYMVGYQDQFYFSRIFRSVVGMTPSEYMKAECGK